MAQQRLITILEGTPDLVTITDIHGKCLYCNDGTWNMFKGDSASQHCSRELACHYPPETAKRLREEIYPYAIAAGVWEGEVTINHPDGS